MHAKLRAKARLAHDQWMGQLLNWAWRRRIDRPVWKVKDDTAAKFAEVFYTELFNNKCLADAVYAARHAIRKSGDPSWIAYSVYGNPLTRASCAKIRRSK